ncbi:hypothetical protein PVA38_10765 [Streptococcus pneumoniae D39]|nr:hypothetical protein PVA38_10765 [Streptococcus pneumoniae D39]
MKHFFAGIGEIHFLLFYYYSSWYDIGINFGIITVSYTHLRAHETVLDLVCRLLLEKKKKTTLSKRYYYYIFI